MCYAPNLLNMLCTISKSTNMLSNKSNGSKFLSVHTCFIVGKQNNNFSPYKLSHELVLGVV